MIWARSSFSGLFTIGSGGVDRLRLRTLCCVFLQLAPETLLFVPVGLLGVSREANQCTLVERGNWLDCGVDFGRIGVTRCVFFECYVLCWDEMSLY